MIVDTDVVSTAVSIVLTATVVAAAGLMGAWLARGNRAAVRHAVLAASFAVLLGLPMASMVVPPVHVAVPGGWRRLFLWILSTRFRRLRLPGCRDCY